jgi:serine/threonine protein kinase
VEIVLTLEQSHSGLLLAERFQLGDVMGHGDISTIYRGQDTILKRPIVVKVIPPEYIAAYRQALQETSELTHPAVVATYDALLQDERLFVVQEAVSARSLDVYLGNGLPTARSLDLTMQLARALAYAHAHNVIHGDLTPVAILVDRRARVHVNNFALPPNTPYFLAVGNTLPDDDKGRSWVDLLSAPLDKASDVRSVGLLLWQMLSVPPASTTDDTEVEVSTKRVFREDVSEPVRELIWRCLDPRHPKAIKDAESLALALEMENVAARSDVAPHSELTPPALRAAREVVAHRASWSTEDTIGVLRRRSGTSSQSRGRGSDRNPGSLAEDPSGPPAKVATEDPIFEPRLRLPSRPYNVSASPHQLDATGGPAAEDETDPDAWATLAGGTRRRPEAAGVGIRTALALGLALFVIAFLVGYFLVALLDSH